MHWEFTPDAPIYIQVVKQFEQMIASGVLAPGDRLLSVREFAVQANVNPNTMQKAFSELEIRGLVYTKRTSGRFITEDTERIAALKRQLAQKETERFFGEMKRLGYSCEEAAEFISEKAEQLNG